VDVLRLIETSSWDDHEPSIAKSWGYEHVHVRNNCTITLQ
jgi:hypothetical protein